MKSKTILTLRKTLLFLTAVIIVSSCSQKQKENAATEVTEVTEKAPFFKLSLAQWSLHKAMRDDKTIDPIDFAQKANEMGFEGLEYVSQLYNDYLSEGDDPKRAMQNLLDTLKAKSEKHGMKNLLIMVDGEGDLASPEEAVRDEAVENHKKWVDAAVFLGCHSIRVNLFGTMEREVWKETAKDGLSKLAAYAKEKNINVIVENHGYLSSDAALLVSVIKAVDATNCGTLPDFGNFCLKREGGELWKTACIEEYDKYKGVREMMPLAKAVSAKSHDFDTNGNETGIDYVKMLQIVKDAGYTGYIGVEYEGEILNEQEGIEATKNLLINAAKKLN